MTSEDTQIKHDLNVHWSVEWVNTVYAKRIPHIPVLYSHCLSVHRHGSLRGKVSHILPFDTFNEKFALTDASLTEYLILKWKFLIRFFVLIQLVKETLISTYCEGEWKLSSKACPVVEGDDDLAKVSICFEVFSVMLVWVPLSIPRAGLGVLQVLCAVLRSTWTSIGSLAVWKVSTAWSWVVTERLLPFTYRIKSLNKIRHVGQGFQNNNT